MNFGKWIKSKLHNLGVTDCWFVDRVGMGNSGVNRWVKGQQPRIDLFVESCSVLASVSQRDLDSVIYEALQSIPSYRIAKMKEGTYQKEKDRLL